MRRPNAGVSWSEVETFFLAHNVETKYQQSLRLHPLYCRQTGKGVLMAKRRSVRISGEDWDKLRKALFTPDGCENAAALLCGQSVNERDERLLVREVLAVPSNLYIDRTKYHLEVAPPFYNTVVDCSLQ